MGTKINTKLKESRFYILSTSNKYVLSRQDLNLNWGTTLLAQLKSGASIIHRTRLSRLLQSRLMHKMGIFLYKKNCAK